MKALALLGMTHLMLASPTFPAVLESDLGLSTPPDCSLCHAGGATGSGTATTPFATAMRNRGMVAGNTQSVSAALQQLETDQVDSDGDGATDVDELRAGTDPNGAGELALPTYGCASAGLPSVLVLAAAGLLALYRRRSHRRS